MRMISQLLFRRKRKVHRPTPAERYLDQLAWNAVEVNPNNFFAYIDWKAKQLKKPKKIWMNGKFYYQTPKGYVIPQEAWVLNKEKFLKMINEGEL